MALTSQIVIYQTEDGRTKLDVRFENETVWLTQALIAELFQTTPQNITIHIKNIYEEGELIESATCKDFLQVQQEGERAVKRTQKHYNLDMIISVGYRVKSHIATRFRQRATSHIREYIIKGFVLDDERLKNPDLPFDYFEELLRRIADIRTSEKRFYRKITDIYATSVDYVLHWTSASIFSKPCRTSYIGQSQGKPQRKSSRNEQIVASLIWDLLFGEKVNHENKMLQLLKII